MDHDVVVRQKMTERYLLNELEAEVRNEFEEHFFDCPECALDVRVGSAFIDHSRVVLREESTSETARSFAVPRPTPGWWSWLRPAITVPVMALLLAVIGYQNLVTDPKLKEAAAAQVLPWTSVNIGTYGDSDASVNAARGKGFLVWVRIPPQDGFSQYSADVYGPGGKQEWSVTIPASASQDRWPVVIPPSDRPAGAYTIIVRGTTPGGERKEVGQGSFTLHLSN